MGESASEVRDASGAKAPALIGNRFRVLDHVGSGAMGVVYRAEDTVLGRVVALKVLTASRTDAVSLARFRKEACALAQVRHENVVRLYSLGEHRGVPYFAMQYVEGPDLATIIGEHVRRGETVATARALDIVRQISAGLGAVHAHNLVHRDVKPNNVVIDKRTGRPILVDFGLARRRTASSPKLSSIGGTPSYMAPEQASDASGMRVSARSDLYALACTAFELLTGRTVFHGETGFAVLVAHAHTPAPRISSVRPELAPFDDAFARALAKSPDERQETCAAFVEELEEAARRIGASQLPTPPPAPASDGVRVLVFAPNDDVRTTIVPVLGRA
ncbi:MAG TPA: serine/threonine-protein kinase, partial [Labilithrix sp.]